MPYSIVISVPINLLISSQIHAEFNIAPLQLIYYNKFVFGVDLF